MSDFSPMMRRIRAEKSLNSKIPKKGRIRLLLILLLFGAALKFGGPLLVSNAQNSVSGTEVRKQSVKKDQTAEKKSVSVDESKKKSSMMSFSEMAAILKQSPYDMSKISDTINHLQDSLVYHYSLDSSLQNLGNRLMKRYKPLYGAIIAMHPNSGRVLSIVSFKHDSVSDLGNISFRSIFPAA